MKNNIADNINNPEKLEELYRGNKREFRAAIQEIPSADEPDLIKFWKIRLSYEGGRNYGRFSVNSLLVVIILSVFTGALVKIPEIFSTVDIESFYTRNLAVIVFNSLILYSFWENKLRNGKKIAVYIFTVWILLLFVNLLPDFERDSVQLSLLHAPLFMWCLFGLAYVSFDVKDITGRISFLRFNGELLVMTGLLLIAGGILTGITIGLFSAIQIEIEDFYFRYIAMTGGVSAPIVAYFLVKLYPNLTNKVGPVIAAVFTPLVLVTLAIYLVAFILSDSRIMDDRNLLLAFNLMLITVTAIIVFAVSELERLSKQRAFSIILLLLAVLAITLNAFALTAIISRVLDGLTPNRTVVLVTNILIFVNLMLIAKDLYIAGFRNGRIEGAEKTTARYLIVYAWISVVVFILPYVF